MSVSSVDAWGIQHEWLDADERPHRAPAATVERLRAVIGTPPDDLDRRAPIVTRPGRDLGLGRVGVRCDGSEREVDGALPDDFPLGYHRVVPGTVDRDNWRIPLPVLVDELADDEGVRRLLRVVGEAGQSPTQNPRPPNQSP